MTPASSGRPASYFRLGRSFNPVLWLGCVLSQHKGLVYRGRGWWHCMCGRRWEHDGL